MENKTILIQRAFEKSDEALRSAEILIDNDSIFSACNRIYYSIFHIVMALGYKYGFTTSKHSQLLGWFNKKFIYDENIFDKEFRKTYKDAYDLRQESDYSYTEAIEKENMKLLLDKAKEFIKTVKTHIESNMEIK